MSIYSVNYKKMLDGYNKIVACIESVKYAEQLECISNLADNWVSLMDKYSDDIYGDRSNCRHKRKVEVEQFCRAGENMFQDLKALYQQRLQDFIPREYEGGFKPLRVKNIYEIIEEQDE